MKIYIDTQFGTRRDWLSHFNSFQILPTVTHHTIW